jgi:hypothetical protein
MAKAKRLLRGVHYHGFAYLYRNSKNKWQFSSDLRPYRPDSWIVPRGARDGKWVRVKFVEVK